MTNQVRVGVIGHGYWGPNLVRNFFALRGSTVTAVADLSDERLELATRLYPTISTSTDPQELIHRSDVDAVAVATPVSTHYALAKSAIQAGKHVLIEKPMTRSLAEADDLIELARQQQVVLMVDHTFVYTGAVQRMRELIQEGELGQLYYFDSVRLNLGLLQEDVSVLWDLAPHDFSILLHLFEERPSRVQAIGYRHVAGTHDEIALITLEYASGFHAHIRVSWLSPVKMRITLIGGSRRMIVYDDVEPTDKIRLYDKGVVLGFGDEEVTPQVPIYRAGDVQIPAIERTEALRLEAEHFLNCIQTGKRPVTGGIEGREVVCLLEAAERSLAAGGAFVPVEP